MTAKGIKPADTEPAAGPLLTAGFDKPVLSIGVAAELVSTHPRTLMIYEDLGLVVPARTASNRRLYSQRDMALVQVVQALTRDKGVNLAGVRCILGLFQILTHAGLEPPPDLDDAFRRFQVALS